MNKQLNLSKKTRGTTCLVGSAKRGHWDPQRGQSLVELALLLPVLLLLVIGVADFARAFYMSIEVQDAARAGAQYGLTNSSDTTGMQTAATNDAPDVSGMTATATYGCICSDGSGASVHCNTPPTCPANTQEVNYVQVNTSATYTTFFPWPKIPSSFPLSGQAILWAAN